MTAGDGLLQGCFVAHDADGAIIYLYPVHDRFDVSFPKGMRPEVRFSRISLPNRSKGLGVEGMGLGADPDAVQRFLGKIPVARRWDDGLDPSHASRAFE